MLECIDRKLGKYLGLINSLPPISSTMFDDVYYLIISAFDQVNATVYVKQ